LESLGAGVTQDIDKTVYWYKKAAKQYAEKGTTGS